MVEPSKTGSRAGGSRLAGSRVAGSRTALVASILVASVLVLGACAAGPNNVAYVNAPHIAGFWLGLWHGLISPITFIVSLFNHNVNIYDVHNNGAWYNFGFMLGISAVFSGIARSGVAAQRRNRTKPSRSDRA